METSTSGIAMFASNGSAPVALTGLRLRARLSALHGKATLDQTFVNRERTAIEAIYTFPLPEGCAVCGFEVWTDERVLTGVVEEANAAIERYEAAVEEGHGAHLAEQDRPDVFTLRAGNLKPGQRATVRLTYVFPLERADRAIRVAFPTTIAPRYATATATDPIDAAVDGDALNPPHAFHVPYGLSVEIDIDLGRRLQSITSPSHAIEVVATTGEAKIDRVFFKGGTTSDLDRDFVLSLELQKEHEPRVEGVRGADGDAYLAATFVPEFDVDDLLDPPPSETIFVLDCSGSMQGESIAQATAALELCLRSMNAGDSFNVCRFGSTWQLLASEPLNYSEETLSHALAWIRQPADLGGTELFPPLQAILSQASRAGRVRQVILLTDGQVTNEPAVIDLARTHRSRNRIFSFGIGSACSAFLVKGIARASGGAAEFITAGERIDDKVLRTFGRLASPLATDVRIDWGGQDVQTLAELPPIFDGDVFSVFGRTHGTLPEHVTLTCTTPAGEKNWKIAVQGTLDEGGVIPTLWARRMIQSLEEVNGVRRTARVNGQPSRERDMLITLSKRYGLLCSLTTFIAVEHRSIEERTNGTPAVRRVPVMPAKGSGRVAAAYGGAGRNVACVPGSPPAAYAGTGLYDLGAGAAAAGSVTDGSSLDLTREPDADAMVSGILEELSPSLPPAPPVMSPAPAAAQKRSRLSGLTRSLFGRDRAPRGEPPAEQSNPLYELLRLQSAAGYFQGTIAIDRIVHDAGGDPTAMRAATVLLPGAVASAEVVHAKDTAVALLALRTQFASDESAWRRACGKAMRYLASACSCDSKTVNTWLDKLQKQFVS